MQGLHDTWGSEQQTRNRRAPFLAAGLHDGILLQRYRTNSGKCSADHDGAGRHTYRLVDEEIAIKGTARPECCRAADRPKHIARARPVGQDDPATRCHGKLGRDLEQEYRAGVPTCIER
jgi:hypothetical protein